MKIATIRTMAGTNIYHSKPVLVTTLDLEEKADIGSHEIPEYTNKLIERLPGLWEHTCSPGHRGGFIERLKRGTYFAHIVEHVALEFSVMAGIEVSFGKSVYGGSPGRYLVVTRFKNEEGMKNLISGAVDFLNEIYANRRYDIEKLIESTRKIIADTTLGPSARALADAATKRNIPWRRIGKGSLLELGHGSKRRRIQTAVTDSTSLIATDLVQDKYLTKKILKEASIPVPSGETAQTFQEALKIFKLLDLPLAVKPLDGNHGNGVSLNVRDEHSLREAFNLASERSSEVLIEEMVHGKDFRILVVNGKMVAAAERIPAHVIGNGEDKIQTLIERANQDPRRGEGHCNILTLIEIDSVLEKCLRQQSLDLNSVPKPGQQIWLRETANLSTGGTSQDVTDIVHPTIRDICERAARIVGLDVCGIDLIHDQVDKAVGENTAIIEVNAGPGLRMHIAPTEGQARDVAGSILDFLYPEGFQSRIPMIAVTGTNGKTTTARLMAHILSQANFGNVGLTTSDGIYIGENKIVTGDTTGPMSTRTILSDPSVDAAVLEVARGGLVRNGLGYDWSDVGVVTNIRPDHIGQDGIETLEDLVKIKSIIIERVRDGGTIVLNADDPEASRLMEIPRLQGFNRHVIYYSLNHLNPLILAHLQRGGRAVFVEDGYLTEARGTEKFAMLDVRKLPYTMGGTALFQVSNVLAAYAGSLGLGADPQKIAQGLRTFNNNRDNLGRVNIYRVRDGFVILDYGHNPDAISAMAEFLKAANKKTTAILGLPGDRADHLLRQSAEIAALGFDRLVLRDDIDLRGRKPGEVPSLVCEAATKIRPELKCEIRLNEDAAIEFAIDTMEKEEVVVLFFDKYDPVVKTLRAYDPIPVHSPEEFFRPARARLNRRALKVEVNAQTEA